MVLCINIRHYFLFYSQQKRFRKIPSGALHSISYCPTSIDKGFFYTALLHTDVLFRWYNNYLEISTNAFNTNVREEDTFPVTNTEEQITDNIRRSKIEDHVANLKKNKMEKHITERRDVLSRKNESMCIFTSPRSGNSQDINVRIVWIWIDLYLQTYSIFQKYCSYSFQKETCSKWEIVVARCSSLGLSWKMPKFLRKTGFFLYNDGNRKTCIYQLKSIQPPDSK